MDDKKSAEQSLKNNANAFRMSAERSLEQKKLPNGKIESFLVPAVVNLAFSIELYFKFLIFSENKDKEIKKTHQLWELFNFLSEATQQEIMNLIECNNDKFKTILEKHSNTFIDWRYLHENEKNKKINAEIVFLQKLANCLENIINEK